MRKNHQRDHISIKKKNQKNYLIENEVPQPQEVAKLLLGINTNLFSNKPFE